ncbi:YL1 nuclear protein-domain-containing protein [Kalaharituber pfeilii]|nr:YL1 nuclear protein-domain-containing protein [Kalaharituber pfeilii]
MPKRACRKRNHSRPPNKHGTAASEHSDSDIDTNVVGQEVDQPIEIPEVESLIAGRQKRATAGNRLASLLDKEASKDDELELLFEEPENDVDFEVEEEEAGLSDLQLESSSEDEEGNGDGGVDGQEDLSGEAELQAQIRAEKAKKRKAPEAFFKQPRAAAPKKKVTIIEDSGDATPSSTGGQLTPSEAALNKHRKKSERISWIPTEGPTRSSSRKLSLQNRAVTHQRLKESEARRLHTIALMEAAAKKKQKENPKREMTQAERLEEAKKTEEMNRKSLNSWEESEAARAEQQRARLAALHNRQLTGAVVRWWSGRAEWDEKGRVVKLGKSLIEEIPDVKDMEAKDRDKRKGGRTKAKAQKSKMEPVHKGSGQTTEDEVEGASSRGPESSTQPSPNPAPSTQTQSTSTKTRQMPSISDLTADSTPKPQNLPPAFSNPTAPSLDGILYYASLPDGTGKQIPIHPVSKAHQPEHPLSPPKHYSTRNLVILQNFEAAQVQSRDSITKTLFPNYAVKREKPQQEVCYITSELARFRDPQTGIPYANIWAYKQIQRIRSGQIRWSQLLEAYVGPTDEAAKGVPEGFL